MDDIFNYNKDCIREFTKVVARHAYEFCNGKINTIFKARRIVFSKDRAVNVGINHIIVGASLYGIIRINTDFILEINELRIRNKVKPLTCDEAVWTIIGHVAHELSHCDQKNRATFSNPSVFTETKLTPILASEIANDIRTVMWLKEHELEIQKEFGITSNSSIHETTSVYLNKNKKLGNPVTIDNWVPYNSIFEIFILTLGDILGIQNIEKFISYMKLIGITKFSFVHNINTNNPCEYSFGNFDRIRDSEYLCNAMLDMLIDDVLIHKPTFMTYMEIDKNECIFYINKSITVLNVDIPEIPDNVSFAFCSKNVLPMGLDRKIKKFFPPNTLEIDLKTA